MCAIALILLFRLKCIFLMALTPSQNKSEWEMTRKTKENLDKAVFQEYTKKDTIERQWW